jgi:hypothetical protein
MDFQVGDRVTLNWYTRDDRRIGKIISIPPHSKFDRNVVQIEWADGMRLHYETELVTRIQKGGFAQWISNSVIG